MRGRLEEQDQVSQSQPVRQSVGKWHIRYLVDRKGAL